VAVYLRVIHGPGRGQVLPIPNGKPVTLGRSNSASYAFDDPLLSRKHCAVECRSDQTRIVDLQSRNGTFVNGQRVGAVLLDIGDRIKIGGMLFEVCPVGARPQPLPPNFQGQRPPATGAQPPTQPDVVRRERPAQAPPKQQPAACQACRAPLGAGGGRELRGRILCARCFDRFDVDEDLIEGFRLLERRDVTSFGVSYVAQQKLMERTVVLRTIHVSPEADKNVLKRFMREAKTGGRLTHPSIVELYDVNEYDDMLYIVTEYVDGESLEEHLRRAAGPLPAGDVMRAMYQIAEALDYAHGLRIVHRDVKPGNIIIRKGDGRAKLQGFILAKNLEGYSVITADGESLGTPYYMAPEQVRSAKNVDARSDIYSWGASVFHCLSGELPLGSRSYGEFIDKVFNEDPPPLHTVVPTIPRPLSALVERCLRRDPAQRPAAMRAVIDELEPIARQL